MIKTVLFDLGNTLYSNKEFDKQYPRQLMLLLARDRGINVDDAKKILAGTKKELREKATGI
jgi:FMN phosphatase YigB (HAD superfamily)